MPWFKLDDKFHSNMKVTRIPRADRWSAVGLWTITASWSADQLTDGFIPEHQFEEMGARREDAAQLCMAHLWSEVDGGYQFNNWGKYQPSAAEVSDKLERLKKIRSIVGTKGAAARWGTPDSKMANEWQGEIAKASSQRFALATPDPTRPDPTIENYSHGKRISEDFQVSDSMRGWFDKENLKVDMDQETAKFVDHYLGVSGDKGLKRDWEATWRSWMRRAQEFRPINADIDPWAGKKHLGFDD